ncbi:hypothetical protein [Actinoplanes sp. GCM10030250]|uniref:hypothetical protein n=1 Tax=Actinoplanes sp. GCM10030250 TaxID=3273376 RepID=UPI003608E5DC
MGVPPESDRLVLLLGDQPGVHPADKAVWKLLHSGRHPVTEVAADGTVPIDVDTRDDYERLLAGSDGGQ